MGEAQPYDPEERPRQRPNPDDLDRADWLVGAEEGMSAEVSRSEANLPNPFTVPKLVRPDSSQIVRPQDVRPPIQIPQAPRAGERPMPPVTPMPVTPRWDAGQSSIPMMRREHDPDMPVSSAPIPELTRDFPMDDAEERARVAAELAERRAQEEAIATRPHEVVKPDEFEIPVVPARGVASLKTTILQNSRVQVLLAVIAVAVLAMAFWPREEKTVSVAHLKSEPERYAGTMVRVNGKVVEVFNVGGSWAFSLVQGRDTIVVFTRVRAPKLYDKIVVTGTLSSGYLDGRSRAAIFENNTK